MEDREERIQHAMAVLSDCIPQKTPDYAKKLRELAESAIYAEDHSDEMYKRYMDRVKSVDLPDECATELPF